MSFKAASCKGTIRLVATLEDGTKKQLFSIVDIHSVEQYLDPAIGNQTVLKLKGVVIDGGTWIEGLNVHAN